MSATICRLRGRQHGRRLCVRCRLGFRGPWRIPRKMRLSMRIGVLQCRRMAIELGRRLMCRESRPRLVRIRLTADRSLARTGSTALRVIGLLQVVAAYTQAVRGYEGRERGGHIVVSRMFLNGGMVRMSRDGKVRQGGRRIVRRWCIGHLRGRIKGQLLVGTVDYISI